MESLSYISRLHEYQLKNPCTVEFEEGFTGLSHDKTFTMRAIVNGQRFPDGIGKTKKEAKQFAAKNALDGLKSSPNIESTISSVQSISNHMPISQPKYTSWLNDYSQKNKLVFEARETSKMDPGNSALFYIYVCKFVCGDREFPEAYGNTKREAREAASSRVYEELYKTQNTEVFDKKSNKAQGSEVAACSPSLNRLSIADDSRSSTPDHNYIADLNHFCQINKHVHDYKLVDTRGQPHTPEFVYKVVIDGKEYPEGQGKSSKEAKQNAAQHAWSELQDQSGWTTQAGPFRNSAIKSEDARLSSNSPCETPSSSDQSTVSSPMVKRPTPSPLGAKPRIKLAPNFSPNRLAQSKEVLEENPAKPSGGQTSSQPKTSRFLEDFDSINPLGDGTFGLVFKARRKLENKYYAVKIVKSRTKACREVDALAHLNNANIVRYYSAWKEDTEYRHESSESNSFSENRDSSDQATFFQSSTEQFCSSSGTGTGTGTEFLYIQMELCEGDTLRVWIDDRNFSKESFPERRTDAARISRQVLTAVDYIHSKDLIHRDLKPPNIMFGSDGGVKVGDFGLVTAAENDALLQERTIDTGSPLYMAPEQVTQYYDKKVDIYAVGLIYFELLWKLGTMTERNKIWSDLRNRNFALEFSKKYSFEHNLIQRMLSASPKDRPDATELIRELDLSTVLKADKDIQSF